MHFKSILSIASIFNSVSAAPLTVSVGAQASKMTPTQYMAWATYNQIQANQQLVVDNIRVSEYAAVNNIMHANQIKFNAIADARDGRTPVVQRSAADKNFLTAFQAAAQTAANAAYAQFHTACVAAAALKTTGITAYQATLVDPLLPSSTAMENAKAAM